MAGRGISVIPSRAVCHVDNSCPGTQPVVKPTKGDVWPFVPASFSMFAVVSSTLLLGSITAMATTIAATSFTENVSVLLQGPVES